MSAFNARIGNIAIHNNIWPSVENTCNRNVKTLIEFVLYNNMIVWIVSFVTKAVTNTCGQQ